ncbi:hypothetical protein AJ88_12095 [Mesorhizobium amorphae CCBAU 01583]|nr:hypothetical protein AJ88_12095 [Mesorhizobium amorphae CCBAU 01583]
MKPKLVEAASPLADIEADLDALFRDGKPIRREFGDGNRLHIDRPLPFLCVHVGSQQDAAFQIVSANASYLIWPIVASPARSRGWWREGCAIIAAPSS